MLQQMLIKISAELTHVNCLYSPVVMSVQLNENTLPISFIIPEAIKYVQDVPSNLFPIQYVQDSAQRTK
jgi:hypothetical protein